MSTITTVVPPFTKVPNINDSVNFEDDTNTFLGEINARYVAGNEQATQMNTVANEVNANAITTQTNKNSVDTNKALTETYRNETLGYRNEVLSYTIPTEATYNTATIDSKINAIAPYSGYMNWKENNFYFNTSASFLASIADKNRYVKFGDKVVDTFLHANYNATYGGVVKSATDLIPEVTVLDQATYGLTTQSSVNAGDYVVVDRKELVTNNWDTSNATVSSSGTNIVFSSSPDQTVVGDIGGNMYIVGRKYIIKAKITSLSSGYVYMRLPNNDTAIKFDSVNEFTYTFTAQSTSAIAFKTAGTTTLTIDNISVKQLDEVYRAKADAPSGTLLTNTTYFEVRDNLPISNQIAFLHTMDATTKAYEGISNEILFNDALAIETPKAIMLKNGFSEISKGLYSKGSKLYVFAGYWQTLNKGAYHPVWNMAGTSYSNNTVNNYGSVWFTSVTVPQYNVSDCFGVYATGASAGLPIIGSTGTIVYTGTGTSVSGRPDTKFYDIIYQDQFISFESSELAYKPNSDEKKRIREYEKYKGVEGLVFTEQKLQTTTGSVATLEVNDGTKYIVNQYIQGFGDSTPYRKRIVSISGNTLTLDSVFSTSKTVSNYIIGGGNIAFNSKGSHLKTGRLGNPSNYEQIAKDRFNEGKNLFGQISLFVDDNGNSLIPDGIIDTFKVNSKSNTFYNIIRSTNSGTTWSSVTPTSSYITNALTLTNEPTGNIVLVPYTSQNNPYQATTPKAVASVEPKVTASNSHSIYKGAIVGNCIGKVQVGNGANGYESKVLENVSQGLGKQYTNQTVTFSINEIFSTNIGYGQLSGLTLKAVIGGTWDTGTFNSTNISITQGKVYYASTLYFEIIGTNTTPSHSTITLDNSNSPASKWFEGICYDNDYEYPFVVMEELVYNTGTTSYDGDDEKFTQLTNGTLTDLNGKTCITKFMVGTPIERRN